MGALTKSAPNESTRAISPRLLAGRVAAVTGGGSGLGRDLALGLADHGAAVAVIGATGDVSAVADGITATRGRAVPFEAQWETTDALDAVLVAARAALGSLDVVVHAEIAPAALTCASVAELDDQSWDDRCERSLRSALACAQAAFRQLEARGGSLVFITPTVALTGAAGLVPYTTALEGIRGLAKSAARQWGDRGIRVNCVAPPLRLVSANAAAADPAVVEPALGPDVDGRTDVAPVVALLAAAPAHAVTGATVVVDGGVVMAP